MPVLLFVSLYRTTSLRNHAIDTIKALACLCVVLIHVSAPIGIQANELSLDWWEVNVLHAFIFWPVPVFIMVSGYFLLKDKPEETIKAFYLRRFQVILIPALFWIGLYMLWGWQFKYYPTTWEHVWRMLLSGNIFDHLYFLVVIIGLYLFVPLLRKMLANPEGRIILAFGALYTLFWVADYAINRQLGQWGRNAATFPLWYLGYFIMGYGYRLLHEQGSLRPYRWWMLAGLLFTQAVYLVGKYYEASATEDIVQYYYANSYFSIYLFFIAGLLFPFLLTSETVERIGRSRWIKIISSASLGIYLIHIMFIDLSHRLFLDMQPPMSFPLAMLEGAGVFIISLVAILLLQLVPGIRILVGGPNLGLARPG